MQTRVAVMSIILEDNAHAEEINDILHLFGRYIIGRMGLPYRQKQINTAYSIFTSTEPEIKTE